jgi:SprT protein
MTKNMIHKAAQLWLDLVSKPETLKEDQPATPSLPAAPSAAEKNLTAAVDLTLTCQQLLSQIGLPGMAKSVQVYWNPRLRSTAGYAAYPAWRIELNPRLMEFEGQVDRTLRHELAHLVAYLRAGRRRIEPHGHEWQQACADLGIPGENARHTLPLPRHTVTRRHRYACPHCEHIILRVRKIKRGAACHTCCQAHAGGRYDERFKLRLLPAENE